jgi:hypothetical protein
LRAARGDDRVDLGRQHEHRYAGATQRGDAQTVAPVDGDGLAAALVDVDAVVGLCAVEVEDHRVDIAQRRPRDDHRVECRRHRLRQHQILRLVDLERARGVDDHRLHAAEEPVAVLAQAGDGHRVRRAGLQQLARRSCRRCLDAASWLTAGAVGPPDEAVEVGHRQCGVGAVVDYGGGDAVDVACG